MRLSAVRAASRLSEFAVQATRRKRVRRARRAASATPRELRERCRGRSRDRAAQASNAWSYFA
eukprot:13420314-Alexandrium_andersonii.AAC.1